MSGCMQMLLGIVTNLIFGPPAIQARDTTKSGVGGTSTVNISFRNDGTCTQLGATSTTPGTFTWLLGGSASDYQVLVTGAGDTPTGATVGIQQSLGTTRTYTVSSTNVDKTYTGTYAISRISTGAVLATGTFSLVCNAAP